MVWFKGDDGWHKHRKRIQVGLDMAGLAAQGIWYAAATWSSDELTEGWVPSGVVDYLAPGISARNRKTLVEKLVAAGLWEPAEQGGQTGWLFHDWNDYNPSRKQVEADREAAARRQKNARDRAREKREQNGGVTAQSRRESRRDDGVSHGVSHGHVTPVVTVPPTRPDPTPKGQSQNPEVTLGGPLTKQDHAEGSTEEPDDDRPPEPVDTGGPIRWRKPALELPPLLAQARHETEHP